MIIIDFGTTKFSLFNNVREHVLSMEISRKLNGMYKLIECSTGAMCVTFEFLAVNRNQLLHNLIKNWS